MVALPSQSYKVTYFTITKHSHFYGKKNLSVPVSNAFGGYPRYSVGFAASTTASRETIKHHHYAVLNHLYCTLLAHNTKIPDKERQCLGLIVADHNHTLMAQPLSSPMGSVDFRYACGTPSVLLMPTAPHKQGQTQWGAWLRKFG